MRNENKSLKQFNEREKEIQQAGSEGAFPNLSLSVIKLKRFVNDSDSKEKENENIVDVTE